MNFINTLITYTVEHAV